MLPILIEQIRDVTERHIHGPAAEHRGSRRMRSTLAVLLRRAAHRLDPSVPAVPQIEAS